jgi:hypothetical protein
MTDKPVPPPMTTVFMSVVTRSRLGIPSPLYLGLFQGVSMTVSMTDSHQFRFAIAERFTQVFGDGNGAMFAAGATDSDYKLTLAFFFILRHEKMQQVE